MRIRRGSEAIDVHPTNESDICERTNTEGIRSTGRNAPQLALREGVEKLHPRDDAAGSKGRLPVPFGANRARGSGRLSIYKRRE